MHVYTTHIVRLDRGVLGSQPSTLEAVVGVGPGGPLCRVWCVLPCLAVVHRLVVALCLVVVPCLVVVLCLVVVFVWW